MSTRRNFFKQAGLFGLGATGVGALSGFNINSKYSAKKKGKIVGHGSHQYRLNTNWVSKQGLKTPIDHCHEMVEDAQGRLIMTTTHKNNNIILFNKDGDVVNSWGTDFVTAHGLTLHDEGGEEVLYIADPDGHKVTKTTLDGKVIMTLEYPTMMKEYETAEQFKPTEVAVAPNGDFYVIDGYGKDYIIQYNHEGEYVRHFGGKTKNVGEAQGLNNAHGICLDTRHETPRLIVTSRGDHLFKEFTLEGKYLATHKLANCSINRPVIKGDNLYFSVLVTESVWYYDGLTLVLNKNNQVVSIPGGDAPEFEADGTLKKVKYADDTQVFLHPHDVCVDRNENVYVTQWLSGRTHPLFLERI